MTLSSGTPPQPDDLAPSRLARRGFGLGLLAVLGLGGVAGVRWFNVSASVGETDLTVEQAHLAALAGDITLIDIRRPEEWAMTGVPAGAVPIDMRSTQFVDMLLAQTKGQTDRPIALICARGVRSAWLAGQLAQAAFANVLDVPEGMMGSGAGPGWLKRGLPVVQP